jgi:hypothetical protein
VNVISASDDMEICANVMICHFEPLCGEKSLRDVKRISLSPLRGSQFEMTNVLINQLVIQLSILKCGFFPGEIFEHGFALHIFPFSAIFKGFQGASQRGGHDVGR